MAARGEVVRAARRRAKLTQEALAGAAGLSRATVQRVEAGADVSFETILSICAVLGLDAKALPEPVSTMSARTGAVVVEPATTNAVSPAPAGETVVRRPWWVSRVAATVVELACLAPILAIQEVGRVVLEGPFSLEDVVAHWGWLQGVFARAWPSPAATDPAGHAAMWFGYDAVLVATSLWCSAMAGRFACCAVVGRGSATPSMGLAAGIPFVRWRGRDGRVLRTWPAAALGALLCLPAAALVQSSGNDALAWLVGSEVQPAPHVSGPVPAWSVSQDSPLAKAGLRVGDVLATMDGIPVTDAREFRLRVGEAFGRDIRLGVDRDVVDQGMRRNVRVDLVVPVGTLDRAAETVVRGGRGLEVRRFDRHQGTVGDSAGMFDWRREGTRPSCWEVFLRDVAQGRAF